MDSKSLNLVNYYKSKYLQGRTIAASLWTIAALQFGLFCLTVLSAFQLSPYVWLTNSLWSLINFKFCLVCLAATLSILPLLYQNVNKFSVRPFIVTRRIEEIYTFFDPSIIILNFCHFLFALVFSSTVLTILQGSSVMSLDYVMVLSTSLVLAVYLPYHNQKKYQFQFPIIQVSKLVQVKTNLRQLILPNLWSSAYLSAIVRLLCCFVVYPQARRNSLLTSDEEGEGYHCILDLWSMNHQFVIIFALHLFSGLHLCLHNIFQTEPITFPITTQSSGNRCLSDALICGGHPLLQFLGFLDLARLSQHDAKRRLDLYSLSVPGRHPLNWQAVVEVCLSQLDGYVVDLSAYVYAVLDAGLHGGQDQRLAASSCLSTPRSPAYSPLTFSPQHSFLHPATPTRLRSTGKTPSNKPAFLTSPISIKQDKKHPELPPFIKKFTTSLIAFFKRKFEECTARPRIYWLSHLPERKARKMFAEAQKYIWLVQGISSLSLHSYDEDQFGVVQRNLSDILNSLLSFHDILCKPLPMSAAGKKCSTEESRLRSSLKSEVKSAIYKITVTFEEGLSSITISPEHQSKLQLFKGFKE